MEIFNEYIYLVALNKCDDVLQTWSNINNILRVKIMSFKFCDNSIQIYNAIYENQPYLRSTCDTGSNTYRCFYLTAAHLIKGYMKRTLN